MINTYPTIDEHDLHPVAKILLDNRTPDWDTVITWQGTGPTIDLKNFENLQQTIEEALAEYCDARRDKKQLHDIFEGQISGIVHQELSTLPISVLDDAGFWRYLALRHFWDYTRWRHKETDWTEPSKYQVYLSGALSSETIPTRLYIRGMLALDQNNYDLASSERSEDGDFWRSHITRVNTWVYPSLVRSLIKSHKSKRMTSELRSFAKRMTRRRGTLILTHYSDAETAELVRELREEGE